MRIRSGHGDTHPTHAPPPRRPANVCCPSQVRRLSQVCCRRTAEPSVLCNDWLFCNLKHFVKLPEMGDTHPTCGPGGLQMSTRFQFQAAECCKFDLIPVGMIYKHGARMQPVCFLYDVQHVRILLTIIRVYIISKTILPRPGIEPGTFRSSV